MEALRAKAAGAKPEGTDMVLDFDHSMKKETFRERLRRRWGALTDDDLDLLGRSPERLREIVRDRYHLDEGEVTKQVNHFFTQII